MYFITGLTTLDPSHKSRCLGYYRDKQEALSAVNENRGGFDQGIYNYLVIEKIGEGIHAIVEEETWFRWVNLVGSYRHRGC
ncbi:hypothetical protein CEB3_c26790 [Peptococcaceae bacterium CEB3]|nr:hypothetical protein CEB3_c26790 [Peptococcaceae bacterium CEB3]